MRLLASLAVCVSLLFGIPALSRVAGATPATPRSFTQTQSFTGGGTGTRSEGGLLLVAHSGHYTSTGQLGSGLFYFQFGTPNVPRVATFTRSDGMALTGPNRDATGKCGSIPISTYCLTMDLDGTADIAHAHIEVVVDNGSAYPETTSFLMRGTLTLNRRTGYAMVDAGGKTFAFGGIDHLGDAQTSQACDLEPTPSREGYWIVNTAGQVYAFGDAPYLGNADVSTFSAAEFVISMSATPTGKGYWLFTSIGRALPFGDARFFGDLHTYTLNDGIVGSVTTPTGSGYYMVGSDGGVFAFGDARFRGSMGNQRLNQPVVGLLPTPDNTGYWLVATDGGVFSFNATFFGSMGGTHLNRSVIAMVPYGNAYLMVATDGGVFDFARAPFFGSQADARLTTPIVSAAAGG